MNIVETAIKNASTVIVLRNRFQNPCILIGQRGANAAFMPNKFVFPGGAVDTEDSDIFLASEIPSTCRERLTEDCTSNLTTPLCVAAIRELWEETGLILGLKMDWLGTTPDAWRSFAAAGYVPSAERLQFVFRAITPRGRPRRFDARFFIVDAEHLTGNLDDFSNASDELSNLQWVPLHHAHKFDLPFITEVVLTDVAGRIAQNSAPSSVPFFKNNDEADEFLRLRGYVAPDQW